MVWVKSLFSCDAIAGMNIEISTNMIMGAHGALIDVHHAVDLVFLIGLHVDGLPYLIVGGNEGGDGRLKVSG